MAQRVQVRRVPQDVLDRGRVRRAQLGGPSRAPRALQVAQVQVQGAHAFIAQTLDAVIARTLVRMPGRNREGGRMKGLGLRTVPLGRPARVP